MQYYMTKVNMNSTFFIIDLNDTFVRVFDIVFDTKNFIGTSIKSFDDNTLCVIVKLLVNDVITEITTSRFKRDMEQGKYIHTLKELSKLASQYSKFTVHKPVSTTQYIPRRVNVIRNNHNTDVNPQYTFGQQRDEAARKEYVPEQSQKQYSQQVNQFSSSSRSPYTSQQQNTYNIPSSSNTKPINSNGYTPDKNIFRNSTFNGFTPNGDNFGFDNTKTQQGVTTRSQSSAKRQRIERIPSNEFNFN